MEVHQLLRWQESNWPSIAFVSCFPAISATDGPPFCVPCLFYLVKERFILFETLDVFKVRLNHSYVNMSFTQKKMASFNGSQLAKMKKSIRDMSLP